MHKYVFICNKISKHMPKYAIKYAIYVKIWTQYGLNRQKYAKQICRNMLYIYIY